jgi:hypothetical protein
MVSKNASKIIMNIGKSKLLPQETYFEGNIV